LVEERGPDPLQGPERKNHAGLTASERGTEAALDGETVEWGPLSEGGSETEEKNAGGVLPVEVLILNLP